MDHKGAGSGARYCSEGCCTLVVCSSLNTAGERIAADQPFIPLAGATLCMAMRVMTGPPTAAAEGLSQTFTSMWHTHVETDPFFRPIYSCTSSTLGLAVNALWQQVTQAATLPKEGAFIISCGLLF